MRPSLLRVAPSLALALGLTACAPVATLGSFTEEGFEHARYDYRVAFLDPSARALLSSDWVLDNFGPGSEGELGAAKRGELYQYTVALDTDEDGITETERTLYRHDLLFRHRWTGAALWVRTLLASPSIEERELSIVVHDYVDGLAGTSHTAEALERPMVVSRDRRIAAQVVHEGVLDVAGYEAYTAVVDLVNLDQRELTGEAVWERSEVVVLRPGFAEVVGDRLFPVLLAVGLVARPEDFASLEGDFHDLLGRITLGARGRLGELREPVLACFPERWRVELRVRTEEDAPPRVERGRDWTDEETACVDEAVRGHSFPESGAPQVFGAVFETEPEEPEGPPAYGDPSAPPPPAPAPDAPASAPAH